MSWVRLSLSLRMPELSQPPALTLAAAIVDLAVLYDLAGKACESDCPLAGLLATMGNPDLTAPAALEPPRDLAAYAWSAARLMPVQGLKPPNLNAAKLARLTERVSLHQATNVLQVQRITFGSPLVLEFRLPWISFAEHRDGWVFVEAVEQLYNARGRIDTRTIRRSAEQARASDIDPQRLRASEPLRGIERLSRDTGDVELLFAELGLEEGN